MKISDYFEWLRWFQPNLCWNIFHCYELLLEMIILLEQIWIQSTFFACGNSKRMDSKSIAGVGKRLEEIEINKAVSSGEGYKSFNFVCIIWKWNSTDCGIPFDHLRLKSLSFNFILVSDPLTFSFYIHFFALSSEIFICSTTTNTTTNDILFDRVKFVACSTTFLFHQHSNWTMQ